MDSDTTRVILQEVFRQWGLVSLFIVVGASMTAAAVAQIIQLRRWQPQTQAIVAELKTITAQLGVQHATCTQHYAIAQRQIEAQASVTHELSRVVESIATSDRARNQEVMSLMLAITGRAKQ